MLSVAICALVSFASPSLGGVPWIPEQQVQQDWIGWLWIDRFHANVNNSAVNGSRVQVLFYGDSITEGWNWDWTVDTGKEIWDQIYVPLGSSNYAISADRTEHVLWRIVNGEVEGLGPKFIVLKVGTNNIGVNTDADIARGIFTVVLELRTRLQNTKILLLGVLPRENAQRTEEIERINAQIAVLDNGNSVRFLNMRDAFYMGNGQFYNELYTEDLIHLSAQGYAKWYDNMNDLFVEMWNGY